MEKYNSEVRSQADLIFKNTFNEISTVGEDNMIDLIMRPNDSKILSDWLNEQDVKDLGDEFDAVENVKIRFEEWVTEKYQEEINEWWSEQEHYPMWNTIFEAKEDLTSDNIMADVDGLYDLGIGVIRPTIDTNACLFIAGAGYDFYTAHWIPLFIKWGWLDAERITKEAEREAETFENTNTHKPELIDWSIFTDVLVKLSRNKDKTIKRHAEGLLKALKL